MIAHAFARTPLVFVVIEPFGTRASFARRVVTDLHSAKEATLDDRTRDRESPTKDGDDLGFQSVRPRAQAADSSRISTRMW